MYEVLNIASVNKAIKWILFIHKNDLAMIENKINTFLLWPLIEENTDYWIVNFRPIWLYRMVEEVGNIKPRERKPASETTRWNQIRYVTERNRCNVYIMPVYGEINIVLPNWPFSFWCMQFSLHSI